MRAIGKPISHIWEYRWQAAFIFFIFLAALFSWIIYTTLTFDWGGSDLRTWRFINRATVPIAVYLNGEQIGNVMLPEEIDRYSGVGAGPDQGPPTYRLKSYEFVPGAGDIQRWDQGDVVYGGKGELIFCTAYSWQELDKKGWYVTLERNVPPGIQDSPETPCP